MTDARDDLIERLLNWLGNVHTLRHRLGSRTRTEIFTPGSEAPELMRRSEELLGETIEQVREAATRIQQLTARVEELEAQNEAMTDRISRYDVSDMEWEAQVESMRFAVAEAERVMALPRDGDDYPLWLLIAVKKSLFRVCEDPTLEDARVILDKIDTALKEQT